MVVDFPAPLAPMYPTDSPSRICQVMPSTARITDERPARLPLRRTLNCRDRPAISMTVIRLLLGSACSPTATS